MSKEKEKQEACLIQHFAKLLEKNHGRTLINLEVDLPQKGHDAVACEDGQKVEIQLTEATWHNVDHEKVPEGCYSPKPDELSYVLERVVEKKIEKRYSSSKSTRLILLVANMTTTLDLLSDNSLRLGYEILRHENHPFDEAWLLTPLPKQSGFLTQFWPEISGSRLRGS